MYVNVGIPSETAQCRQSANKPIQMQTFENVHTPPPPPPAANKYKPPVASKPTQRTLL
jgi:hypothetical protein